MPAKVTPLCSAGRAGRAEWSIVASVTLWALALVATGCRAPTPVAPTIVFACRTTDDCNAGLRCLGGQCRASDDGFDAGAPDAGRPADAGLWASVRLWLQSNDVRSYDGGAEWRDLSGNENHFTFMGVVPGWAGALPTPTAGGFVRFADGVAGVLPASRGLDFQGAAKQGAVEVVGFYETAESNGAFVYSSRFVVVNPTEPGFMLCGSVLPDYDCQVMASCGSAPTFFGNVVGGGGRTTGTPAHLVLVFDGPDIRYYRDGALVASVSWSTSTEVVSGAVDAPTWYLGGPVAGGGYGLTGVNLGLVRSFHRALTAVEVQEALADARRRLSF